MADSALATLLAAAAGPGPALLVLDENTSLLPPPAPAWQACTNRIDVANAARAAGWPCACDDFAFADLPPLQRAVYRVSKEKRVVEHILQSLWSALVPGGELWLAGYKQEGVKTFASRAAIAWQAQATLTRGNAGLHLYRFVRGQLSPSPLSEIDYHALSPVADLDGATVWSKPGVFAWDRIDAGSALLLTQLPAVLEAVPSRDALHALDLGCGHGLLALALLQAGCGHVIATDNNAAAVTAARHNLAQVAAPTRFEVTLDDCAAGISQAMNLIVCNPPFHQGFAIESELTDRFLDTAQRLLRANGTALFVVNAFIPLERKASTRFAKIDVLVDDRRFRVLALREPRRRR